MKYKKESLKEFVNSLTDKQKEKIKNWDDDLGTFEIDESVLKTNQKQNLEKIMDKEGYAKVT